MEIIHFFLYNFEVMKDKAKRYSRKAKVKLKDLFKKNENLVEPLDEELSGPKHEIHGFLLMLGYLGIFLIVAGIIDLIPIIIMCFYPVEFSRILAFLIPGVSSILVGIGLSFLLKGKTKCRLGKYQDLILLIIIWFSACLIAAIPFMLPDYIGSFRIGGLGLDYVRAIFETISGFTTTGLSILEGEISPSHLLITDGKCFLFFRSVLMFFGGIGFVLVLTCVVSDTFGIRLYYSEGHTDRLLPNLYKSAKMIFGLYAGLVLVSSIALYLGGMNEWTTIDLPYGCENDPTTSSYFEALCIAMTHLSSGGFSTRDLSIYAYNSIPIEIITEIIMLFSCTNFIIIFSLVTFKFKKFDDLDLKVQLTFAAIFIPILILISGFTTSLSGNNLLTFGENLRYNIFYYISASSTTGSVNSYNAITTFSIPSLAILTLVMAFGGQQGSTAGGIKFYRIGIICKSIYWSIREKNSNSNMIYPHYTAKYGQLREVNEKDITDSVTYCLLHFLIIFVFAILVSLGTNNQFSFVQCCFEVSSALATTGLSAGITSFSQNDFVLTLITMAMFIGRLELYTFIYAGSKCITDIKQLVSTKIIKHHHANT